MLLRLKEGGRIRFRCHTGHAYSADSLLAAVSEAIVESLWSAIRALEEGGMLMNALADHLNASHDGADAQRLAEQGNEAHRHSNILRKLASEREPLTSKP